MSSDDTGAVGGVVRLRGHHLICLHFFRGEGYTPEFVRNLRGVMARLGDGDGAGVVVEGADDVCRACGYLVDGLCANEVSGEEKIRRLDALALDLLGLAPGDGFSFATLAEGLAPVLGGWRASACRGCTWESACDPREG